MGAIEKIPRKAMWSHVLLILTRKKAAKFSHLLYFWTWVSSNAFKPLNFQHLEDIQDRSFLLWFLRQKGTFGISCATFSFSVEILYSTWWPSASFRRSFLNHALLGGVWTFETVWLFCRSNLNSLSYVICHMSETPCHMKSDVTWCKTSSQDMTCLHVKNILSKRKEEQFIFYTLHKRKSMPSDEFGCSPRMILRMAPDNNWHSGNYIMALAFLITPLLFSLFLFVN